jgi:hypothetical protein
MDHNQSWTGRGAFEQGFNQETRHLDRDVKLAAQVCRLLAPMPSTVEPLLVEYGQIKYFELSTDPKVWHDLVLGAVRQLQTSSCFPSIPGRTQTIIFAAG